jgi:hypothetical protein
MKEITATSMNLFLVEFDDGVLSERVECVLTVAEPVTEVDAAGQCIKRRVTSDLRFTANAAALRHMAKEFSKYADMADALLKRVTPQEKKAAGKAVSGEGA